MSKTTIRNLAIELGIKENSLYRHLRRHNHYVGINQPLSEDQIAILLSRRGNGKKSINKKMPVTSDIVVDVHDAKPANVMDIRASVQGDDSVVREACNEGAPKLTSWTLQGIVQHLMSVLSDIMLIAIVVGHGLLIVQELSQMAGQIGQTAGIMIMLSILSAISLSSNKRWYSVSYDFVWFIFMLDCASVFLHYRAFKPSLGSAMALGLAITVSAVSFFSLFFYRNKNSNLFEDE